MKSNRIKLIVSAILACLAVLLFWRPWNKNEAAARVDPSVVEAAAQASRENKERNPPPPEEPMPAGAFNEPMTKHGD